MLFLCPIEPLLPSRIVHFVNCVRLGIKHQLLSITLCPLLSISVYAIVYKEVNKKEGKLNGARPKGTDTLCCFIHRAIMLPSCAYFYRFPNLLCISFFVVLFV